MRQPHWSLGALLVALATVAKAQDAGEGDLLSSKERWFDGVVAIVGARSMQPDAVVIFKSDVELLAHLLGNQEDSAAQARTRKVIVEELIGEGLIVREARRVGLDSQSPADTRSARTQLLRQVGGEARLGQLMVEHGISTQEVDALIERRAMVAHFLRVNLEDTARVSEAAVRARYDQGNHPFVDEPYAVAAQTLRLWMQQRALAEAVEKWVAVLRTRDVVHRLRAPNPSE